MARPERDGWRRRRRPPAVPAVAALLGSVLLGCGGGPLSRPTAARAAAARAAATSALTSAPTTVAETPLVTGTTAAPTTTSPPVTVAIATTSTTRRTLPRALVTTTTTRTPAENGITVPQLAGDPTAGQAIVVAASGYGSTTAVLTAYQRVGTGWRITFGPWSAYLGYNGVAQPGAKREGDGRTPSGTYGFSFFFGVDPDPGVHFPYRRITGPTIVWDDDPASPLYNEWVDTTTQAAGKSPEPMDNQPVYDYGAVIAYNPARTPGLGSAIFLHVAGQPVTAGCVALPAAELVPLLTWLQPAAHPVIDIGVFP